MQTAKKQAAEVLRRLPDDVSMKDIQYHLYVQEKIRKGRKSIAVGRSLNSVHARERLSRWLEKQDGALLGAEEIGVGKGRLGDVPGAFRDQRSQTPRTSVNWFCLWLQQTGCSGKSARKRWVQEVATSAEAWSFKHVLRITLPDFA